MSATAAGVVERSGVGESDRAVRVRIPVRIDFAGGWSDVPYFSAREGGAVLNAAIGMYVEGRASWTSRGLELEYRTDVPRGSGLGASAALDVAWLALTHGVMGHRLSAIELAESAFRLEKLLGVEGGKQDQYAAALGGFNCLTFGAETEPAVVESLRLEPDIVAALENRLVLCYTGSAHESGSVHEQVWRPYLDGDARIASALREIRDSVRPAREALVRGELDELGRLMTANGDVAQRMVPGIVTPQTQRIFAASRDAGAIGGKPCGAGGGGCVVLLAAEGRRDAVRAATASAGGGVLPLVFAPHSYWGDREADA